MSSLSPEAQALLNGARAAGGPSATQRAAMKRAVLAAALAPGTAAAIGGALAPAAAPVVAGSAGVAKFLVVGILSAAIGAGATFTVIRPEPVAPTPVRAVPVFPPERVPSPPQLEAPVGVVEAPAPVLEKISAKPDLGSVRIQVAPTASGDVEFPLRQAQGERLGEVKSIPSLQEAQPIAPNALVGARGGRAEDPALAQEVASLSGAMADVDAKRFHEALDRLQRYRSEFPSGALATEARVLDVLALCGLGRVDDAKAVVSALPQSAANNPAMRRIESSCAFPQRIGKGAATQKIQGDDK